MMSQQHSFLRGPPELVELHGMTGSEEGAAAHVDHPSRQGALAQQALFSSSLHISIHLHAAGTAAAAAAATTHGAGVVQLLQHLGLLEQVVNSLQQVLNRGLPALQLLDLVLTAHQKQTQELTMKQRCTPPPAIEASWCWSLMQGHCLSSSRGGITLVASSRKAAVLQQTIISLHTTSTPHVNLTLLCTQHSPAPPTTTMEADGPIPPRPTDAPPPPPPPPGASPLVDLILGALLLFVHAAAALRPAP